MLQILTAPILCSLFVCKKKNKQKPPNSFEKMLIKTFTVQRLPSHSDVCAAETHALSRHSNTTKGPIQALLASPECWLLSEDARHLSFKCSMNSRAYSTMPFQSLECRNHIYLL